MVGHTRKVLIADPDTDAARLLTKALRQKGYQVHYAPDGSRALELAILRHPDLALFDESCRLLDASSFIQIIRTNPRTEDIPVVLLTAHFDEHKARGLKDGYIKKPFNLDEVLSRIEHILHRNEAARELRGETKEIEGQLAQLPLADLMQLLAMNRRSGKLTVRRSGESAELFVGDGRPLNARIGVVEGEKALFRLLTWTEGSFAFVPGPPTANVRIQRTMEDALLEGLRHADELGRYIQTLPPPAARLKLSQSFDASVEPPMVSDLSQLLDQPRTMTELLDLSPQPDLDVLASMSDLLARGLLSEVGEANLSVSEPLLGPAEVHALRARVFRNQPLSSHAVAKIICCAGDVSAAARILDLPDAVRTSMSPSAMRSSFGTLASLHIDERLVVDFLLLPAKEASRPLWRPFCAGAVGGLLLDDSPEALDLAHFLGWELRLPLACPSEMPPSLLQAPAGALAVHAGLWHSVRMLLLQAAKPPPIYGATSWAEP